MKMPLLHLDGHCLAPSPELIELTGDYGFLAITADARRIENTVEMISLFSNPPDPRFPNAGLLDLIRLDLARRGFPIESLPKLQDTKFSKMIPCVENDVSRFVRAHARGLISAISHNLADIITQVTIAYPEARVVVIGNKRQIKDLAKELKVRGIKAVWVTPNSSQQVLGDYEDHELPRVICSTALAAAEFPFATSDLVFLAEATACTHQETIKCLGQVSAKFRLYGIKSPKAGPLSTSERINEFAVFGGAILYLDQAGNRRRDINYYFDGIATEPLPNRSSKSQIEKLVWKNTVRNARLCRLAQNCRQGLTSLPRTSQLKKWCQSNPRPQYSVTVLVERPIHALAISDLLPDWPIYASDDSLNELPRGFRERFQRQRYLWKDASHQIVLLQSASQFRGELSDIVIWAGGCQKGAKLPESWLHDLDYQRPLLIVDLGDQFNGSMKTKAQSRRSNYEANDIFPIGITLFEGRVDSMSRLMKGVMQ